MQQKELDYVLERLKELLSIDSPTGFTEKAAEYVREQLEKDSIPVVRTAKGGVLADLRAFAKKPSEGGAEVLRMAILRDGESFDRVELSFSAYDAQNYLYELMGEKRLLVSADKVDAIVRQLRYLGAE